MIHTITNALKKDRQALFVVLCDFEGFKKGFSTISKSVGDYVFEGRILNSVVVKSSLSLDSMTFSDPSLSIQVANTDRLQDLQKTRYLDAGTGEVFLYCDSLVWADVADFPIFTGAFRTKNHNKFQYAFDLVDRSNTAGQTIDSLPAITGNPGENIEALLTGQTTLTIDDIDFGSLGTMKSLLGGWALSTEVDTRANAFDVIDRILLQCVGGRVTRFGKVAVVVFDLYAPTMWYLTQQDFLGQTIQISSTPQKAVANDIYVEYEQNNGSWDHNLTVDHTNNRLCKLSRNDYGPRPQVRLALADIPDEGTARAAVQKYLDWKAFRHDLIQCKVPHHVGFQMLEGDVAEITLEEGPSLDGAGWIEERFILLDRSIDASGISQRWWRIGTD